MMNMQNLQRRVEDMNMFFFLGHTLLNVKEDDHTEGWPRVQQTGYMFGLPMRSHAGVSYLMNWPQFIIPLCFPLCIEFFQSEYLKSNHINASSGP